MSPWRISGLRGLVQTPLEYLDEVHVGQSNLVISFQSPNQRWYMFTKFEMMEAYWVLGGDGAQSF